MAQNGVPSCWFPNSDFGRLTELILLHEWHFRNGRMEDMDNTGDAMDALWYKATDEEQLAIKGLSEELKETRCDERYDR